MKFEQVKEIANAVLFEGYLLYPYRHSAIKNRQRWTIGVVYPQEYSEANGGIEPCMMRTECLVRGNEDISLDIHVRFLHLLLCSAMQPGAPSQAQNDSSSASEWSLASRLAHEPFEEGIERQISVENVSLRDLLANPRIVEIDFPAQRLVEDVIVREQRSITGIIRLSAEAIDEDLFKFIAQIENTTPETALLANRHNEALLQSFVSTHTILQVKQGEFISLLEPPEALQAAAQGCQNARTWPVLVGSEGEKDALLSSPIIMYDYPQIAPESPGSLFDGTEIDEILTLRILTLTEEEKEEMRQGDARAREILERTEALTPEQFMKLHGTIRSMKPVMEGEEM
ncbi:MAG: hypothetical protein ACRDIV_07595 [Ktedonobacteraceae bacterium]